MQAKASGTRGLAFACAASIAALAISSLRPRPLVLWNASASAPPGLYFIAPGEIVRRGDLVISATPEPFRMLAARRGYLPPGVPLVKRVAAVEGDEVCAKGFALNVDGGIVAISLSRDSHNRPLPRWVGCSRLKKGDLLLLGNGAQSFDGRYFGPVGHSLIIGKAVPIWLL